MDQEEKVLNIEEVQKFWDNLTAIYPGFDSAPQSFYYAIIHMLEIPKAKRILDVGCGRCTLVPHCLELMNEEASYLATDLSEKMVELAKEKLKNTLRKFDSSLTFEDWCQKHKFSIRAANGEEVIEKQIKFDRIICNMVLMLTENAGKMLKSFYQQAQEGCLLGVSVWGKRQLNLIQNEMDKVVAELNVPVPKTRSNFHLYNKISKLAEENGWNLVATWEQVSVFPYNSISGLQQYASTTTSKMKYLTEEQRNWVYEEYMKRQKHRLEVDKQGLTFPAQILILRK